MVVSEQSSKGVLASFGQNHGRTRHRQWSLLVYRLLSHPSAPWLWFLVFVTPWLSTKSTYFSRYLKKGAPWMSLFWLLKWERVGILGTSLHLANSPVKLFKAQSVFASQSYQQLPFMYAKYTNFRELSFVLFYWTLIISYYKRMKKVRLIKDWTYPGLTPLSAPVLLFSYCFSN